MQQNVLDSLIGMLCRERGERVPELEEGHKPDYFRALCNIRPPVPVSDEFLRLQDEYLSARTAQKGVADVNTFTYNGGIAIWRGDITRLNADAIVNACNCSLLGCFQPLHGCIDNAIHSAAGVQVRLDCNAIMRGGTEPNGRVRVTSAYNLPSRYIFHTVGPMVSGRVTEGNRRDLEGCYNSCLAKAEEMGLSSMAFCCISTGVFGYPVCDAAAVAISAVRAFFARGGKVKVIFDVFSAEDCKVYEQLLGFSAQ